MWDAAKALFKNKFVALLNAYIRRQGDSQIRNLIIWNWKMKRTN